MTIRLIVTGGTLDKRHDVHPGELEFGASHVPEMLTLARCTADIAIEIMMMKDSLDVTAADRDRIAAACRRAESGKVRKDRERGVFVRIDKSG